MELRYISIALLIAEAGGDPWSSTGASKRVARLISDLARAFHDAGVSTAEADAAFNQARQRFEWAWNRENGDHPVNDSAEVQRVTTSLKLQAAQLPRIGVDLENIAAALAEAQRSAGWYISALEQDLEDVDCEIGEGLANDDQDEANALCDDAVAETRAVLVQLAQPHSRQLFGDPAKQARQSARRRRRPGTDRSSRRTLDPTT